MTSGQVSLANQHVAATTCKDAVAEDNSAFDRLIQGHQPQITRLVGRLLAWPEDRAAVDDIVQEVFLAAWLKRRQFRADSSPQTWLSRIAINKTRNYVRHRMTWRRIVERVASLTATTFAYEPTQTPNRSRGEVLRWAIHRLRPADREIIVLRYLEEYSPEQIVEFMGLNRNAVDARLSRARKRLKELILRKEQDHGPIR